MTRYAEPTLTHESPGRIAPILWLAPLILGGFGILMVTSTTSNFVYDSSGTPFTMGMKQLRSLGLGFVVMLVASCITIRFWYNVAGILWVVSVIMAMGTLVPGIGMQAGGAIRWLNIAGVSVQPSEIMILAVVLECGKIFDRHKADETKAFITMMTMIAISAAPLLCQPDLGTTIFLTMVCMGMFVGRFGWKLPLCSGTFCAAAVAVLVFIQPYRMRRIFAFLDPFDDPRGNGYQIIQGLIAFANGGGGGAGLGHGFQKLQYLPAASTDFIYAALGEELGLVGTMGVLALAAIWMLHCRSLYKMLPDGFKSSVTWGITLTVILPFFINIGGVTNLMPLTGMPLPFVSYGGSAMIMSWARIGILLRLEREILRGYPA
ncbi:MAG: putative lipid II flippase FtsW [Synergistaceae bacterium]|jgi:cell division protein FtsW|nr:putative lipid II flippase FtsW [Synergistaceae bacterium]